MSNTSSQHGSASTDILGYHQKAVNWRILANQYPYHYVKENNHYLINQNLAAEQIFGKDVIKHM